MDQVGVSFQERGLLNAAFHAVPTLEDLGAGDTHFNRIALAANLMDSVANGDSQTGAIFRASAPLVFTIIFLDWMRYYLHRVYHAIPWLWKIHRVHHTDMEVDVTTGLRFHPIELLITILVEALIIYLLGAPVYGVFLFELWIGVSNLFNHSNIRIPIRLEKVLHGIIVTPDMHRVHHSANPSETNRNFGFNFSWWDRLFMTYHQPLELGKIKLGLNIFEEIHYSRIKELLLQPFYDKQGKFKFKNITHPD